MASLKSRLQHCFTPVALRSYLAEFISTFIFVFASVGAATSSWKMTPAAPGLSDGHCRRQRLFFIGGCLHRRQHIWRPCESCRHVCYGSGRAHHHSHGRLLLDRTDACVCNGLPSPENSYSRTAHPSSLDSKRNDWIWGVHTRSNDDVRSCIHNVCVCRWEEGWHGAIGSGVYDGRQRVGVGAFHRRVDEPSLRIWGCPRRREFQEPGGLLGGTFDWWGACWNCVRQCGFPCPRPPV